MISREKGTVEFPTLHTLTPEDGNYMMQWVQSGLGILFDHMQG